MKKFFIIVSICFSLLLNLSIVNAASCANSIASGKGNKAKRGVVSAACGGNLCARTYIFSKPTGKFAPNSGNSAIYGFRITLIRDSGNISRNVWATDQMRKYVANTIKKKSSNKYDSKSDYYVKGTGLTNYGVTSLDPGLKQLDDSNATYAGYIKNKLTNEKTLNNILKTTMSSSYNSVTKLADADITRIKIEPIYVLYVLGNSIKGSEYFIEGTAQEIYAKAVNTNINVSGIMQGNDWHIIDNYSKTVYQGTAANDKDGWYKKLSGGTGGVGYLNISKCKTKGSITVVKQKVNNKSDINAGKSTNYDKCAQFTITNTKTKKTVATIKIGKSCGTYKKQYKLLLSAGKYKVVEKSIADTTTYYKADSGGIKTSREYSFTISTSKKHHKVTFYNQPKKTEPYTITVYKGQFNNTVNFQKVYSNDMSSEYAKGCFNKNKTTGAITCYYLKVGSAIYSGDGDNHLTELIKKGHIVSYNNKVTFHLEKKDSNGNWVKVKNSDKTYKGSNGSLGTEIPKAATWEVKDAGSYRVVENSCAGCGGNKTYSKVKKYKNSSGNWISTEYRQGKTSKGFYVGNSDSYKIWYLNAGVTNNCQSRLDQIKNITDDNKAKAELISLYHDYPEYNLLLNFNESTTNIRSRIDNGSSPISCAAGSSIPVGISNGKGCDDTFVGLGTESGKITMLNDTSKSMYESKDNINLSQYVNYNASSVANYLFDGVNGDDLYCYVNYDFDYGNGVIDTEVNLLHKSFLWEAMPSNQVGTLKAFVHCEGSVSDANNYNSDINNEVSDNIINSINNISLSLNGDSRILQKLNIVKSDEIEYYKDIESSDLEEQNEEVSCQPGYTYDEEREMCFDSNGCLFGYTYDSSDQVCYSNDDSDSSMLALDTTDEVSSLVSGEYFHYNAQFNYGIVYAREYYADLLSGTATTDVLDNRLGWGIPLPITSKDGNILFNYNFNTSSALYATYKSKMDATNYSCPYQKQTGDINARFVNVENPFLAVNGDERTTGSNWNSCYTALGIVVGKYSNVSNNNMFCKYGDINCDGIINHSDVLKYENIEELSEKEVKLADVNHNATIDYEDKTLLEIYINNSKNLSTTELFDICEDYSINNNVINKVIKERNNSSSNQTPMYSFVFNSKDIKRIKDYNKNNKIIDTSSLACDGDICISDFITSLLTQENDLSIQSFSGTCLDNAIVSPDDTEYLDLSKNSRKLCKHN